MTGECFYVEPFCLLQFLVNAFIPFHFVVSSELQMIYSDPFEVNDVWRLLLVHPFCHHYLSINVKVFFYEIFRHWETTKSILYIYLGPPALRPHLLSLWYRLNTGPKAKHCTMAYVQYYEHFKIMFIVSQGTTFLHHFETNVLQRFLA